MSFTLKEIVEKSDCQYVGGVDEEQIKDAQSSLDMKFPDELIEYLKNYGTIVSGSNELNGLGTNGYLNIVKATMKEKELSEKFPSKHAVIQDIGMEGILILIDEENKIYEWTNGNHYKKIYDSLNLFLEKEVLK